MNSELTLREATAQDLPALLELYRELGMDDGEVLSLEQAEKLFLRIANYPDYRIYLAEQDGQPVGTFALLIMDNLGHLGAPSAVIEDVVVTAAWRGAGTGHFMMQQAAEIARRKGCYKFLLSSNIKREAAHRFYQGLGYARHGYSFFLNHSETGGITP